MEHNDALARRLDHSIAGHGGETGDIDVRSNKLPDSLNVISSTTHRILFPVR
jgi:hypothetical protein